MMNLFLELHNTCHQYGTDLGLNLDVSESRSKRKERNLWQRRFWEHLIRDETDFAQHCDYIHYNPVHHQLCQVPSGWQFSSVHRFIAQGSYSPDWGECPIELEMDERRWQDGAFAWQQRTLRLSL